VGKAEIYIEMMMRNNVGVDNRLMSRGEIPAVRALTERNKAIQLHERIETALIVLAIKSLHIRQSSTIVASTQAGQYLMRKTNIDNIYEGIARGIYAPCDLRESR